jgi:5,10-methylenetetrahydromethanopterin reductase
MDRIGFLFSDKPHIRDYVRLGQLAEELGYYSLWVSEPRMARDAVTGLALLANSTKRMLLGPGVTNNWTRGPGLTAVTWATLNELAPGRVAVGLGAYWDPLASNQGITMVKPLTAMREYVGVLRRLFRLETVTFEGEVVKVRNLSLDAAHAAQMHYGKDHYTDPSVIPIYLGPSGDKMLELTGEIADGAVVNAVFSTDYMRHAAERIKVGALRAGRDPATVEMPKLVYVALDRGPDSWLAVKRKVARYLGAQPHVRKASGLSEAQLAEIWDVMGGWPPKPGGLEAATEMVPDDLARSLIAFGSEDDVRQRLQEYVDAGASYPILITEQEDVEEIIRMFAPGTW